jgi:hypothetical protein
MRRRKYKAEEIIQHLRTVELEQGRGDTLEEASRFAHSKAKLKSKSKQLYLLYLTCHQLQHRRQRRRKSLRPPFCTSSGLVNTQSG